MENITFFALGIILILFAYIYLREDELFEMDKVNPYRRKCKKCGQVQEECCFNTETGWSEGWWEERGEVVNPNCKCHKHSDYKNLY